MLEPLLNGRWVSNGWGQGKMHKEETRTKKKSNFILPSFDLGLTHTHTTPPFILGE